MNIVKSTLRILIKALNRILIVHVLRLHRRLTGRRVTVVRAARIGHLAFEMARHYNRVSQKDCSIEKSRILFAAAPCNRLMLDIWKRHLRVFESRAVLFWFNADTDYLEQSGCVDYLPFGHNEFEDLDTMPHLVFTHQEKSKGAAFLRSMGLTESDWFVCFQARDDAYHVHVRGLSEGNSHRNSEIETYLDGARLISELGGYAIRVGWGAGKALPDTGSRHIIDYSLNYRDDFADIFLMGNSRFFVAPSAGTLAVPPLFGVPVLLTNQLPPRIWPIGHRSLMMPKMMVFKSSGDYVPFSQLEEMGIFKYDDASINYWDRPAAYEAHGIKPANLSPGIIRAGFQDMIDADERRPVDSMAREVQEFYKRKYCASIPSAIEHGPDLAPSFSLKFNGVITT
jgi:putative glycosyltransferase (TIGR04372 family)